MGFQVDGGVILIAALLPRRTFQVVRLRVIPRLVTRLSVDFAGTPQVGLFQFQRERVMLHSLKESRNAPEKSRGHVADPRSGWVALL